MGLFRTAGRVAVASSVHGRVQERQRAGRQAQAAPVQPAPVHAAPAPVAAAPAPVAAPAPAKDMDAMIAQLKQLGELRDLGVLSDEEFEGQKAKLLAA
ncbi:Short C-terminal domain-containing protein [Sanguibacter gelidistatuariae]|uniref:Short C-terminal domain-containing protein n=1 Tax=Sanguibacter gelidistatuariae TaxID=1814289 RepID=A0A1G6RTH1_9MICO|nr:SHOCT domain-containing protein [Sanguibacter gelidistatuariae]SDD07287.1 Short C-terminal domain-containing protein [Sanguibacter gelidistatuariae]